MPRQPWDEFFFEVAALIATRSTCLRRQYGVVLVRGNTIVATGFNGAPRGCEHCSDVGCAREGMESGQHLELCRATHGEQNAVVNAAREGISTIGTELYIHPGDVPCPACARIIINAGIVAVHCTQFDYPGWEFSQQLFEEADVVVTIG